MSKDQQSSEPGQKDESIEKPRRLLENPDAKLSMYINDISRLFMHRAHRKAEQSGVPVGYHRLLPEIARNDGITQLGLSKLTRLTAPTVSVAVTKMESDGLVRRVTDTADMRQMRVYLTEKGMETVEKVREAFREADSVIVSALTDEEQETVAPLLRKMLVRILEEEDKA